MGEFQKHHNLIIIYFSNDLNLIYLEKFRNICQQRPSTANDKRIVQLKIRNIMELFKLRNVVEIG